MACPICGEECHCAPALEAESASHTAVLIDPEDSDSSEQQFAASLEAPAAAPLPATMLPETPPLAPPPTFYRSDETWRREVSSRVNAYKARRRRGYDPDASLRLDFEAATARATDPEVPLAFARSYAAAQALAEQPKVIEFPKLEPPAEELAEPVLEAPRILEAMPAVEERPLVELSPPMPAITLEAKEEEPLPPLEDVQAPMQVAPLSQRALAAMVDGVVVLLCCAVFGMIFLEMEGATPQGRLALAMLSLIPSFFWSAYQYLFLVHTGTTPGMQVAQLSLETFDGSPATRRVRRRRALAMAVSSMSVGLGYLWALVDEDRLCWHDRITRTYVI